MKTYLSRKLFPVLILSSLSLCLAMPSFVLAGPLLPGTSMLAPAEPDPVGGSMLAGGVPVSFSAGLFSGTLTSTVLSGDVSNPYGGLTFTYLLSNNPDSADSIHRLTINDFAGFLTDASFQAGAGDASFLVGTMLPPATIDRSLSGTTVGFSFISPPLGPGDLMPGMASALLVVQTSATAFVPSFASVINATTASVASFAPTTVPEPSAVAFVGLGLATLVTALRFPRRRA